jgi:hypothetical protein
MSRSTVVNEPDSKLIKLDLLQSEIAALQHQITEQKSVGQQLQRDFDAKLQTVPAEKLIPLKQKLEIHHAQLDQLTKRAREKESILAEITEDGAFRTQKLILHLDHARATKEYERANAEYLRLREEFSSLPAKIQTAFFNQSEALKVWNKTRADLQSVAEL